MYIPFERLSSTARIWIYPASRPLSTEEQTDILQKTLSFLNTWVSHGNPLQASAALLYDQFLILAVEESFQGATGCAVDASIQFIRSLEGMFQLTFLDRTQVAFRKEDKTISMGLGDLQQQIKEGGVTGDSLVFDHAITKKDDLDAHWLVPAKESWLKRYFALSLF